MYSICLYTIRVDGVMGLVVLEWHDIENSQKFLSRNMRFFISLIQCLGAFSNNLFRKYFICQIKVLHRYA